MPPRSFLLRIALIAAILIPSYVLRATLPNVTRSIGEWAQRLTASSSGWVGITGLILIRIYSLLLLAPAVCPRRVRRADAAMGVGCSAIGAGAVACVGVLLGAGVYFHVNAITMPIGIGAMLVAILLVVSLSYEGLRARRKRAERKREDPPPVG